MIINIQPYSFLNFTATKIELKLVSYTLGSNQAIIHYKLFDSENESIIEDTLQVNQTDWGTNDSLLVSSILNELNLTQI